MATTATDQRPQAEAIVEKPLELSLQAALSRLESQHEDTQVRGISELWSLVLIDDSEESLRLQALQNASDPTSVSQLQEQALGAIMKHYVKHECTSEILLLFEKANPLFETLPKAKTAKISGELSFF